MLEKIFVGLVLFYFAHLLHRFIRFYLDLQYKKRLVSNIPGPETKAFVGCMHLLPKKKSEFPAFFVEESRKALEQGHNVMKFWLGPRLVVFPLDSDTAKVILSSNIELDKGDSYVFLNRWLGRGLVTVDGDHWHKSRRILTPVFHFARLDDYGHAMDYHCRRLVDCLKPKADGHSLINMYEDIKHSTLDIIVDAGMGVELNSLENSDQPYSKALESFANLVFMKSNYYYMSFNWLWMLLGYEQQTRNALHVMKNMTSWLIKERMSILKTNNEPCVEKKKLNFLDLLLELHMEGNLSLDEVREQVDTFLFAGHDTTSHGISWTVWCLATHPEIQERVYQEIVETFGESDTDFDWQRIKELQYFQAVIKESMRLYAPVPMIERRLRNEIQMDGFTLPKGTSVKVSPFLLHHNYKVFGDHWRFDPDNFYTDKLTLKSNSYVPFASGPRNCIGQRFAQREMQTMLCHLIHNFEISTPHKMEDNGMEFSIVLRPTLGVPVILKRRHD